MTGRGRGKTKGHPEKGVSTRKQSIGKKRPVDISNEVQSTAPSKKGKTDKNNSNKPDNLQGVLNDGILEVNAPDETLGISEEDESQATDWESDTEGQMETENPKRMTQNKADKVEQSSLDSKLEDFILANPELLDRINAKRKSSTSHRQDTEQVTPGTSGLSSVRHHAPNPEDVNRIKAQIHEKQKKCEEEQDIRKSEREKEHERAADVVRQAESTKLLVHRPPDKPKAVHNIWIIGDQLLAWGIPHLQDWIQEIQTSYMYDNFDVYKFYQAQASENRSYLSRMVNSLIDGLNSRNRLPKYILVLFDHGFLKYQHSEVQNRRTLSWVLDQLERVVAERKEMLPSKCFRPCEPRFLLILMPPKLGSTDIDGVAKIRRSYFNNKLQSLALKGKKLDYLEFEPISALEDHLYNVKTGYFTPKGFRFFWTKLDDKFRIWERHGTDQELDRNWRKPQYKQHYSQGYSGHSNPYKLVRKNNFRVTRTVEHHNSDDSQ